MHFKHLILLSLFLCVPFLGKAQTDLETKAKNQNSSKLDRFATDYVLQRPRVTKRFKHKKFGDHLFVEGAAGITLVPQRVTRAETMPPSVIGNVSVGDWVSPEHGWRVSVTPAFYKVDVTKLKTVSFSADYMMNFSAIAHYRYNERKPFEMFGIAGFKYMATYFNGTYRQGLGFHLGLRGQYNFSKLTYIYLEPQVEMLRDKTMQIVNDMHFRPVGNFLAGVGYNLLTKPERSTDKASYSDFFRNGTFFSFAAGPSAIATPYLESYKRNLGMQTQVSVGKWFNPSSGLRLSGHASIYRDYLAYLLSYNTKRYWMRSVGLRAEYMLNMHNLFGGPRKDRLFEVNAIAGIDYSVLKEAKQNKHCNFGLGGALQGTFRISNSTNFFIEPRVDVYGGSYVHSVISLRNKSWDVVPTLLAGMSFHPALEVDELKDKKQDFETNYWMHHFFVEAAGGVSMMARPNSLCYLKGNFQPKMYYGLGKWFTPLVGTRLWAEQYRASNKGYKARVMGFGADVLWNITNSLLGYEKQRPLEAVLGFGVNVAANSDAKKDNPYFFGGNVAVKGIWHVSPLWGLYIEPHVRLYKSTFIKDNGAGHFDLPMGLMVGTQVDFAGNYNYKQSRASFNEDGKRSFVSVGGGLSVQGKYVKDWDRYCAFGEFGFGQWFSPEAAWRVTVAGMKKKINGRDYAKALVGADYMADCSALAYGYNKDRRFSVRTFFGGAVGVDYLSHDVSGGKSFVSDAHVGTQLAVRVLGNTEVYLEPKLSYQFGDRYERRRDHLHPTLMLGVAYNMSKNEGDIQAGDKPKYRQFINLGVGTLYGSPTLSGMVNSKKDVALGASLGYGRWFNATSGWHVGYQHSMINRKKSGMANIMSVQANYMVDLVAALSRRPADERVFQLTGMLGAGLYMGQLKGDKVGFAPGGQASLQIGARVADNIDVYLEPSVDVYSKKVFSRKTQHPAEGELRLQVGTRFNF